jgi:AcrR family transcriptional regulator
MSKAPESKRPTTRTRMDPDTRRERILETALQFFAEHGYGASMADLADAAGVSRPALYHYFPAKADLFAYVVEAQVTEAMRYILPAATTDGNDRQRLRAVLDALLRFAEERPQSWQILFHHLDDHEPEIAAIRANVYDTALSIGVTILPEETGLIDLTPESTRGRVMAEMVVGSLMAVIRWWHTQPQIPREEILDAMAEISWKGVGGVAMTGRRRARTTRTDALAGTP